MSTLNNFKNINKIKKDFKDFLNDFKSNPTYQEDGYIYKALNQNWKEVKNSDEFLISVYNIIRITLLYNNLDYNNSNYNISIIKYTLNLLLETDEYTARAFTLFRAVKDPEDFLVKLLSINKT